MGFVAAVQLVGVVFLEKINQTELFSGRDGAFAGA